MARIGTDTGGTFTDLVAADGRIAKVPSTPDDPGRAVREGLAQLAAAGVAMPDVLAHGTTVATNALLTRTGAAVTLVTTAGFADVIEIARQDRPSLYDASVDRPEPLVPRRRRLEVAGRLAADGSELEPVPDDVAAVLEVPDGTEAVAVVLLHADRNPGHERAVAGALRAAGWDVTASHELAPEFREYERTATTVANAYLRPICRTYLHHLVAGDEGPAVLVMTSAGGLVPGGEAAEQPARLLLSGPAGGVLAGAAAAVANGFADAVTFDMGGTSTDVCLVRGGRPEVAAERAVDGLPVRLPSVDVHTIGAGGGSIARLDAGGALTVGPASAGAVPGPACYGRGGGEPTVTDADLALGRIPAGHAFAGLGVLDDAAARAAIASAGVTAEGIVAVVDAAMVEAVRAVTIERGVDPRRVALVAFGGAGPLHACAVADALGMPAVVVPARAGVLSAVGILGAPRQVDLVRSWPRPDDHDGAAAAVAALADEAVAQVLADGGDPSSVTVETLLDCRYAGQSHELRVASVADFAAEHERRNGYRRPDAPIEVVALRATARRSAELAAALPDPERATGVGPVVLAEDDCTIWVPDGWAAERGAAGALVLIRVGAHATGGVGGGGVGR